MVECLNLLILWAILPNLIIYNIPAYENVSNYTYRVSANGYVTFLGLYLTSAGNVNETVNLNYTATYKQVNGGLNYVLIAFGIACVILSAIIILIIVTKGTIDMSSVIVVILLMAIGVIILFSLIVTIMKNLII